MLMAAEKGGHRGLNGASAKNGVRLRYGLFGVGERNTSGDVRQPRDLP
jgi:hypothetical protein